MPLLPRELAEIESKPIALAWLDAAEALLSRPDDALTTSALATNFAFDRLAEGARPAMRARIAASFAEIRRVLARSGELFTNVSERDAREACRTPSGVGLPPAYAIGGGRVYFTPAFAPYEASTRRGFGPKCRAAMVIHECVHIFDGRSGEPEIHISEFAPAFDEMTPEQQVHNASAYASFAGQVFHRELEWPRGRRYGAGRPSE